MPKHNFNPWAIGGTLMAISASATFADLTWVRVLFAALFFLSGLVFILRGAKPHWFEIASYEIPGYEEKRFNSDGVLETRQVPARQVPAKTRWPLWGVAAALVLVLSCAASLLHYRIFKGQKTTPVVTIAVSKPITVTPKDDPSAFPVQQKTHQDRAEEGRLKKRRELREQLSAFLRSEVTIRNGCLVPPVQPKETCKQNALQWLSATHSFVESSMEQSYLARLDAEPAPDIRSYEGAHGDYEINMVVSVVESRGRLIGEFIRELQ